MAEKNITSTSRLDHPINIYFIQKFLAYAMPRMPHMQFGQKIAMPEHVGDTVKWRRWSKPVAQTTPLDEVTDPSPILPAKTDISATVAEYGARVRWTGWLNVVGLNQETSELTEWLSNQFRLTLDTLCREVLANSASTTTMSSGSPTPTLLNKTDIDTVVRTLLGNDSEQITSLMGASALQTTTPLMPAFIGIAHTDLMHTIEAVAGFKELKNYASTGGAYDGEYGATGMIRWILSTNGYVASNGTDYYCPIIAKNAYGNINIPGGEDVVGYTPPNEANSEMNRYSVYYWLMNYVCRILDDLKINTIICTAS